MEKINLINNKILEPQDEPQNYLNDNNISIISKTQKNDDKSFANEISNRNDKIEISNINNDKEEINNNNNSIRDSDLSTRKFVVELQSKDFVLNNVHNPIMQNLDNNVSYSTQIKERMEEKNKNYIKKNLNNKIDVISEKESNLSHNFDNDEKKEKYQNYAFKQINCSNSKNNNNIHDINSIKFIPGLKNIDNNMTVSNSKKNYSLLVSKHINSNDNNDDIIQEKIKEKNSFNNITSINNEEENINNNTNKRNIEDQSQEIEEEINDLPNQDSPRNNNNKIAQIIDIEKNPNINNNQIDENKGDKIDNISNSKKIDKKDEEIMDRLNFFEDDNILTDKIKLSKKESKNNKFNNINLEINDSFLKENNSKIKNNKNNINEISKHSNRPPSDLTGEKISSLNNLYDQFVKKKKDQLNETNNSITNNNNINNNNINNNMVNNSLLNESLNTFTQNLNKKWKDLSNKDINNIKSNREQHYNIDNTYDNNINNNFSYLDDDKLEDEKIFDKVNQFTRVALNELKQSQLSVFSKEKTIKKYE